MHDEAAISAEFEALAGQADKEFTEFRRSADGSSDATADAILARSCVFGCLHNRHFLESREMLLNELRWLKQTDRPRAPRHALSMERYQQARDGLLDELILRFASAPD